MKSTIYQLAAVVLISLFLVGCRSTNSVPAQSIDTVVQRPAPHVTQTFSGTWVIDQSRSTAIDPWRNLSLEIQIIDDTLTLERRWRGSREGGTSIDSSVVAINGPTSSAILEQWPDNRHLGAYLTGDRSKSIRAFALDGGRTIGTEVFLTVSVQQGEQRLRIYSEYRISPDNKRIELIELRSTRPTPTHYVFNREVSE